MTRDALTVLRGMYAGEQEYLDAGGPGRASFATLAPFFAPDVVLHQAEGLPYGGAWRGHGGMDRFLQTVRIADGRIVEIWPFYWDTAEIAAAFRGTG